MRITAAAETSMFSERPPAASIDDFLDMDLTMTSLMTLFDSLQDVWMELDVYEPNDLANRSIDGEVAELLSEVGSGEIQVLEGGLYFVLDPDGVVHWSRDVSERLQGIAQPAGLLTFMIDEGGGTYAFSASNGVYVLCHRRGLIARYDTLVAFFEGAVARILAGLEPFEAAGDQAVITEQLESADSAPESELPNELSDKLDTDFRPYDATVAWKTGDLMVHSRFGRGIVRAVKTTMYIQVEFLDGKQTLSHKGW